VNHLFQDSPSVAIGLFEAHMRKMADDFSAVRRAELLESGTYDAAKHEPELTALTWERFTDEEFALCPPIVSMGGDGAMLDIGFQNLSRLLASGKPIRVVVLDTQVYSNTGGQSCTSGFTGQVADMAAYGKAQHGKTETRKELALLASRTAACTCINRRRRRRRISSPVCSRGCISGARRCSASTHRARWSTDSPMMFRSTRRASHSRAVRSRS
jgi:pyruvate/2-oxoacid:ferredoxin oxidoreductase beta subunit